MITIPLTGGPNNAHQQLSIQLGQNFTEFNLNYVQYGGWCCDIKLNSVDTVKGAMLETNCNIVAHWNLVDFGELYLVGDEPTIDNLGSANSLVWVSPDE